VGSKGATTPAAVESVGKTERGFLPQFSKRAVGLHRPAAFYCREWDQMVKDRAVR
jgi:hypothetical protein